MTGKNASLRLLKAYCALALMERAKLLEDERGFAFKVNHEMFPDWQIRDFPKFEEMAYFDRSMNLEFSSGLEFLENGAALLHSRETDDQVTELAMFLEDLAESEGVAQAGAVLDLGLGPVSLKPRRKRDLELIEKDKLDFWPRVSPLDDVLDYYTGKADLDEYF